jgi:hypothetical protein
MSLCDTLERRECRLQHGFVCLSRITEEFAQAAFACRGPASHEGKGAFAADEGNPRSASERLDAHHVVGNDAEDAS